MRIHPVLLFPLVSFLLQACGGGDQPQGPFWEPKSAFPTSELAAVRGQTTLRGIIHLHSTYSHDGCDEMPFFDQVCALDTGCQRNADCPAPYECYDGTCAYNSPCQSIADCKPGYSCVVGERNEGCFQDDRAGMCDTRQDFVFLTDHPSMFAAFEYPEVLLYQDGDALVEREGLPVANRINCGQGRSVLLSAGSESDNMPIGLEHHIGDTEAARRAVYNDSGAAAIGQMQAAGALVFTQHTEGRTLQYLMDTPVDGIEIYNTHYNLLSNIATAMELFSLMDTNPDQLPTGELLFLPLFQENSIDLEYWSKLVAKRTMPGVLATDAHRNVFKEMRPDGERVDSFRRMMHWFSNYVLVPEGSPGTPLEDRTIKAAIAQGRLYGVFTVLGYPEGFDFCAKGDRIYEIGEQPTETPVELELKLPRIAHLDPAANTPDLEGRILKAGDGTWELVASGADTVRHQAGPGVYRAEVHMMPYHLVPWLGSRPDTYLAEQLWIYTNPIYVGMGF